MAFNVRVFGFEGIDQIPIVQPRQYNSDSVFVLRQPYIWQQMLSADAVAVSTAPLVDRRVTIIRIEVPDGRNIRYEINPPNREGGILAASLVSPILSGFNNFKFAPGWLLSIIDASGLP